MTDTYNMNETTGERIVREVLEEPEEVQLAQIMVSSGVVYDVCWLPGEGSVRIEIGLDRKGRPDYLWYPESWTIGSTLAKVIGCDEEKIRIWGLKIFNDKGVTDALSYETRRFKENTWYDYASEGYAVQLHVQLRCAHAEDDTNCCAETCGRGMTDTAFRAQLEKVFAQNQALESLKQYSSDAEIFQSLVDEDSDSESEVQEAEVQEADGEETEAASEADDEEEEEPDQEAELQEAEAEEAEAEAEAEEAEAEEAEAELSLKQEESYDFIEQRLREFIIFLLGFVVAMLLVSLNELSNAYRQ